MKDEKKSHVGPVVVGLLLGLFLLYEYHKHHLKIF